MSKYGFKKAVKAFSFLLVGGTLLFSKNNFEFYNIFNPDLMNNEIIAAAEAHEKKDEKDSKKDEKDSKKEEKDSKKEEKDSKKEEKDSKKELEKIKKEIDGDKCDKDSPKTFDPSLNVLGLATGCGIASMFSLISVVKSKKKNN